MAITNSATRVRHQVADGFGPVFYITGKGEELLNFFDVTSLDPVSIDPPVLESRSVRTFRRKRYPGDPGHVVSEHSRSVLKERASGGGGAMPGERFWCERPTGNGDERRSNARQFTYEGSWSTLKEFARQAGAGNAFILRNHSGKSITVAPN
jgi:hypothetical protein